MSDKKTTRELIEKSFGRRLEKWMDLDIAEAAERVVNDLLAKLEAAEKGHVECDKLFSEQRDVGLMAKVAELEAGFMKECNECDKWRAMESQRAYRERMDRMVIGLMACEESQPFLAKNADGTYPSWEPHVAESAAKYLAAIDAHVAEKFGEGKP